MWAWMLAATMMVSSVMPGMTASAGEVAAEEMEETVATAAEETESKADGSLVEKIRNTETDTGDLSTAECLPESDIFPTDIDQEDPAAEGEEQFSEPDELYIGEEDILIDDTEFFDEEDFFFEDEFAEGELIAPNEMGGFEEIPLLGEGNIYTIDDVKAMIETLSADPTTYSAADKENVDKINNAFQALSDEDQATLDVQTPPGEGQPYGRVLETAVWAILSLNEVDDSTTLADGTYDGTTDPKLTSEYSKGKSTSSRDKRWSIKSVTVENGKATAVITVESTSYTKIWTQGRYFDKTNSSGNCEFAGVPVDLNNTLYLAGVSSSMPRPIAFSVTNSIDEPAQQEAGEKTELTIENKINMFKAVTAYLETSEGKTDLVMALSGIGYKELFMGTYEQAIENGNNTDNWIHGYMNDDKNMEFRIPIEDGKSYIPVVAVSDKYYQKYLDGENVLERAFYPRQIELDTEAKTLVTDDYHFSQSLKVINNVKMFSVAGANLDKVAGPNSNNYSVKLVLKMGSDSFDKAFVGTAEAAAEADETIAVSNSEFALPAKWIETFGKPETVMTWIGVPTVVSFHSKRKNEWYERELTINESASTLVIWDDSSKETKKHEVEEMISSLPDPVGLKDKEDVEKAREAYDNLGAELQAQLENADALAEKLQNAVDAIEEAQKQAEAVADQIKALSNVGADDEEKVSNAQKALEALDDAQKALVNDLLGSSAADRIAEADKKVKDAKAAKEKTEGDKKEVKPELPAAGTTLTSGNAKYTVVTPGSTVAYQGPANKKAKTATVPAAVTIDGVTYQVDSIAANAFKNCNKLTKVTVNANIKEIGANAFAGTKSLRNVIIKSKLLAKIGKKAFSKAGSKNYAKLKVRVPKAKLKAYRKMLKNAKLSAKAKVTK